MAECSLTEARYPRDSRAHKSNERGWCKHFDRRVLNMPLDGEYELSHNDRIREQVERYEATNGQEGGTLNGKPVILMTYKGVKSGKIRKTPLMRIEHNGTYAVVASKAGASTHPYWYYNIVANPLVELQDGALKQDMRVREVFGPEKDEWWKRADAAYSEFPAYRARAGREIPVLVLEPLAT
jgi:deazaflavin-dependent oxidoreductase (nitroreductase family)